MAETCFVFFREGASDLDAAARSLKGYGLTVTREGDHLVAGRTNSPQFRVRLVTGPSVQSEACDISDGSPGEAAFRECTARFEVEIDDLDAALDEINTLMEVQGALQDTSRGYLFLPWNGNLQEPWVE